MHEIQNNLPVGDLDWLAYEYAAGELSDSQCAAFEERLAIDQSAREAVAAAVELIAACQIAFEQRPVDFECPVASPATTSPQRRRASPRRRTASPRRRTAARLAVVAGTLAACVTIAWLGQFQGGGSGPGLADRDAQDRGASLVGSESLWGQRGPAQQLAAIWADLGESLFPDITPLGEVTSDGTEMNTSVAPSNGIPSGDEADLAAPDWLMAALDDPTPTDDEDEG